MKDDRQLFTRMVRTGKAAFWFLVIALAAWGFVQMNGWLLRSELEPEPASTEKYEWPRPNDPDTFTAQTAGWYTTISTGWRLISTNRECPNLEPVKKGTP